MYVLIRPNPVDKGTRNEITYYQVIGPFLSAELARAEQRPDMSIVPLISPGKVGIDEPAEVPETRSAAQQVGQAAR